MLAGQLDILGITGADFCHRIVRQPAIPVLQAVVMPMLACRVLVVVIVGSNAEMIRINARWRIATMQNNQPIWNRPPSSLVGVPMGADSLFAWEQENAVAVVVFRASPQPTTVAFFHPAVKSLIPADFGVKLKLAGIASLVIVLSAQVPSDCRSAAFRTGRFTFGLIAHSLRAPI